MKRLRLLFLAPSTLILVLFFGVPMGILLTYTFLTRGAYGGVSMPFSGESWQRILDPLYLSILARSFLVAAVSTLLCLVLGFPLALFISRSGPRKNLYLALVMLPFWTSFLVRTYAWMFLLRDTGLINTALQALGLIREPLPLLYNWWAVILGLVYGYLPFMVLPLFSTLERLDPSLMEAAADLGAKPTATLFRVIIPLTAPGLRAGAILVFIPCLGAYLTPDLLGGGKTILIGTLIQNQFSNSRDWPFGSAVSVGLMAIVMVLLWLQVRRKGESLL